MEIAPTKVEKYHPNSNTTDEKADEEAAKDREDTGRKEHQAEMAS